MARMAMPPRRLNVVIARLAEAISSFVVALPSGDAPGH
jgi:hypothetical protein